MDLLFKRYANPFLLLDTVIPAGFLDFVVDFLNIYDEEMVWEVWLHKDIDKSFNDFKESLRVSPEATDEQLEDTINNSKSMLNGFIPS